MNNISVEIVESQKILQQFTDLRNRPVSHYLHLHVLTCPHSLIKPRKPTDSVWWQTKNLFSSRCWSTYQTCWTCFSMSQRTTLTRFWKTVGELVRLKDMTRYSKWPRSHECRLPLILLANTHQVIHIVCIQLWEDGGLREWSDSWMDERQWVFVLSSYLI